MRIDTHMRVSQVYSAEQSKRSQRAGGSGKSDMLEISDFGKEYHVAKQIGRAHV